MDITQVRVIKDGLIKEALALVDLRIAKSGGGKMTQAEKLEYILKGWISNETNIQVS